MATPQPPPPTFEFREADLRRPDFRGGEAVTMADGQDWFLPRPIITITATEDSIGFAQRADLGDDFDALIAELEDAATDRALFAAFCKIAAYLLRVNYDLPPGAVGRLVRFERSRFADDPMTEAVRRIARGYEGGPKPGGDGSDLL